jgi:hypothetical protein
MIKYNKENIEELYKLYLEVDDPTEYSFVSRYIGTWNEWEELTNTIWFKPLITKWRKELETRIRSKALRALREVAKGDTRDAFIANKYLLDNFCSTKDTKRGRPSRADINYETNRLVLEENRLTEDYKLINVK